MPRVMRWLGYGAGTFVGLVGITAAALFVGSERVLNREYSVPAHTVDVPTDSASVAEGRRLAILRGCYKGCHGASLEGAVFMDEPWVARIVTPNLTKSVRTYSDADLERIIRHGVRPDGRSVFVMPSEAFAALSDVDLGRILAFLRSEPPIDGPQVSGTVRPLGWLAILRGDITSAAELIGDSDSASDEHPALPAERDIVAYGRYLARSICAECHGASLQGDRGVGSPNLMVVAGYSHAEFETLLRTGTPRDGRKLGLMADVVRDRFGAHRCGGLGAS